MSRTQYPKIETYGDWALARAHPSGENGIHTMDPVVTWASNVSLNAATFSGTVAKLSYNWYFKNADVYFSVTKNSTVTILASETAHTWKVGEFAVTGYYGRLSGGTDFLYSSGDVLELGITQGSGTVYWRVNRARW